MIMPLPKRILTSRNVYMLRRRLGAGGSGSVYEVTDVNGVARALKLLDPDTATTQKRLRFQNELDFCARHDHPHIVKVVDDGAFENDGRDYAFHVTPLYPATLRKRMDEGIPPDKAIDYFAAILDGMRWAHSKGTVHRDLKPENILCGESVNDLVIADFGCARFVEEELAVAVATHKNERLANFLYAAPEQAVRGGEVSDRADVYALGLILHEMFTGEVPRGTSHKTVGSIVPEYAFVDAIVDAMRRQTPADRPSVDEVQVRLAAGSGNLASERAVRALQTPAPSGARSDPLIDDPVRFIGLDYRSVRELGYALVIYNLSAPVNGDWVQAFRRPASCRFLMGFEPEKFEFHGAEARVQTSLTFDVPRYRAELETSFKEMLSSANAAYQQMMMSRRQAEQHHLEEKRRQSIADERIRQALRGGTH